MENDLYFADKYLISSTRLKNWNYSSKGFYFVTICTYRHNKFLGQIVNGRMKLSLTGKIAKEELLNTTKIRPNIKIVEYAIMPNHLHILFQIISSVETHCNASLQYKNKFGPQVNNLSSIVRGFKGSVTRKTKKGHLLFSWQSRFYDRIIRTEMQYHAIKKYIYDNPINWSKDPYNS